MPAALDPVQQEVHERTRQLTVIGITGTKGKTTTTCLIAHLLNVAGRPAVCASTVETVIPGEQPWPTCKTQAQLLALLRHMKQRGIDYLVLETPSYSLARDLPEVCCFAGAVFTNLGHEHLNQHGSVEAYQAAKQRLFQALRPPAWAVINGDDLAGEYMVQGLRSGCQVIRYGLARRGYRGRGLAFAASERLYRRQGARFTIVAPEGTRPPVRTRLQGEFNVYNALAATSAAYCLGISPKHVLAGLASFVPPPGRFEVITRPGRPVTIVDYAHTPESLAQVLAAARRLLGKGGRLWTVFGCGGETDPSKRPLMGQAAAAASDGIILTNDNPRREDPAVIVAQIKAGCGHAPVFVQLDRARAIAGVLNGARPTDVVLIAGRGHETHQVFADGSVPFSDRDFVYGLMAVEP